MMDTISALRQRFPYIVKWEARMGSFDYYVNDQLLCAATDSAPENAIFKNSEFSRERPGEWSTTDDITNPVIILEWQLPCPQCGGKRAKVKGCTNTRHEVYA
jgi:Zn finger protein HypA/HybF involved in hydrogenase expression